MILAFNKPYGVLSQFTSDRAGQRTLKDYGFPPQVYPLGRLDMDSEGLLLLSDEPELNAVLLHPMHHVRKTYLVQVEKEPSEEALEQLQHGLVIQGRRTLPCRAWKLNPQPDIADRIPPVRYRISVPTFWICIELREGRNRQIRRMTGKIGHGTLRLIRTGFGPVNLNSLEAGEWIPLESSIRQQLLK
jgi:23S rRNA pseudouridine2457 synthase